MRCTFRLRGSLVIVLCLFAGVTLTACGSGENAEAGAVGTAAASPLTITFSNAFMTIDNRTGVPIVDVKIEIETRGLRPPFRTTVPRIEASAKSEVPFSQFRGADGTPFRRGAVRTRGVTITATDVTGKPIEQEVPFE